MVVEIIGSESSLDLLLPACYQWSWDQLKASVIMTAPDLSGQFAHLTAFLFSAVYPSFVCFTLILTQLFYTRTYKQHVTSIDLDGDGYSSETEVCFICMLFQKQFIYFRSNILVTHAFHCNFQTFRGYAWKGRDCNDLYKHIHPGAR